MLPSSPLSVSERSALCALILKVKPKDLNAAWESEWKQALGARRREDFSVALLPGEREWLEEAVRRLFADPNDGPARICLWFLRRDYAVQAKQPLPGGWQAWTETQQQGAHLTLLPPPASSEVTILLPTYNRLPQLQKAVQSILGQSHSSFKLIIADDGSTDGTAGYCRVLADTDPRVSFLPRSHNLGLYATMEQLYQATETELVMSLADDDCLTPHCLAACLDLFERYPWIAMAGGGYYYLHYQGQQLRIKQYGPYYDSPCVADTQLELQRAGIINPLFGGGALFRKAELLTLSKADPEAGEKAHSAWDWLLTAEFLGRYEVGYSPEIAVAYVDHKKNEQFTHGRNWGPAFFYLLERLIQRYEALFGPKSYPAEIIQYFIAAVAEPYLVQAFQQKLASYRSPEDLDTFLQSQRSAWETYRQIRQNYLERPNLGQALLNAETVAGLTLGDIPGLNQGQTPLVLQNLLNHLLR
ncbi:MAG: glycosyltransferase [Candidatus Sericytochromatia bacterium]|nr:glycosyltransferase [Candidatus Sericytochromatia bacterium]